VRLEIANASGKGLAKADAPSPGGRPEIALAAGSIGSVGALLEVAASAGGTVCRSVWRYRDGSLTHLPILDGSRKALPDCEPAGQWLVRWDESQNSPARYVRERTRETPRGRLHETRVFDFKGFELTLDPKRSGAEINGVPIPDWYRAELYPKAVLETLFDRYGLSGLRKAPRLRFEIDPDQGVFALVLRDREGELRLPVTASKPIEGSEPGVELAAGEPAVRAAVTLARGSIPQDVVVHGAGERFDRAYAPVIHWNPRQIRLYPDAEQELCAEVLPGVWATDANERVAITAGGAPGAVRFGNTEVQVRIDGAPDGTDLLLVPRDGSPPAQALTLRGANAFVRMPVVCAAGAPSAAVPDCRVDGPGQGFKRIGSQLNVR